MKDYVIIGSAPVKNSKILRHYCSGSSFVVCADGGLDTALKHNITPNLIVGDFDSAKTTPPQSIETIRLPVHKDDTDTMFAVKEGFRRGFCSFVLLGVLGGARFDHSYASLCNLQYIAEQGGSGIIEGDHCRVYIMTEGTLALDGLQGNGISVFPFGVPSCKVTYRGLEYPLTQYTLCSSVPLGVSNRIVSASANITLHEGIALVIIEFNK